MIFISYKHSQVYETLFLFRLKHQEEKKCDERIVVQDYGNSCVVKKTFEIWTFQYERKKRKRENCEGRRGRVQIFNVEHREWQRYSAWLVDVSVHSGVDCGDDDGGGGDSRHRVQDDTKPNSNPKKKWTQMWMF